MPVTPDMQEAEIGRTAVPGKKKKKKIKGFPSQWKKARPGSICLSSQLQHEA
jgi:hypothetical protein